MSGVKDLRSHNLLIIKENGKPYEIHIMQYKTQIKVYIGNEQNPESMFTIDGREGKTLRLGENCNGNIQIRKQMVDKAEII